MPKTERERELNVKRKEEKEDGGFRCGGASGDALLMVLTYCFLLFNDLSAPSQVRRNDGSRGKSPLLELSFVHAYSSVLPSISLSLFLSRVVTEV